MKKYIFLLLIMILTIFVLNTVIDPGEEKKPKTEAKTHLVAEIYTSQDKEKPALLYTGKKNPKKLSKEQVEKAAREIRPALAKPFEDVFVSFSKTPGSLSISEWNNGKETKVSKSNIIRTVGAQSVKLFIIRGEWPNEGQATYVAKIRVTKTYSYQDLLTPRTGYYTVVGFFEEEDQVKQMPAKNGKPIDLREVSEPLGHSVFTYPDLAIEKLPTYYVFGDGNAPIRFDDHEELERYLGDGTAYEFGGQTENWKIEMKSQQKLGEGKVETYITYVGNEDPAGWTISFYIEGPNIPIGESNFALDHDGKFLSVLNDYRKIVKKDSFKAIVYFNGNVEEIPLEFNE